MGVSLRGGGKSGGGFEPLAEINVTPMVDVMLVLLIIFMVTAPLLSAGVKVNLPKAGATQPLNSKEPLVVTVDKEGKIYLGADPMSLDNVADAVRAKAGEDSERIVHIRGDKDVAFGQIVALMDVLSQKGLAHIAIVTTKAPAAPTVAPAP
jgi:biopolymer transport protein TolR